MIPVGEVPAHFRSPSIVSPDPAGRIGIKTALDGRVVFRPVKVVRAETAGIHVTGPPDEAELITVAQGFARDGKAVTAGAAPEGVAALDAKAAQWTAWSTPPSHAPACC